MGSFWGMSPAGREAEGWPREFGAWSQGQFKSWLPRSDYATSAGQSATDWARAWAEARANNGIGTPGQMIEYGRQIMSGVDDYVSNKRGRIEDSISRFGELPTWQDTAARIDAANEANRRVNSDNLSYIDQTRNYALKDIGDTYGRGVGYETDAYGRNVADLTDRYNALDKGVRDEYGNLRSQNRDVYGGLKASAEDTYGTGLADIEQLRPGSEFKVAQTARSFAPMMASTAGKLRRMGVDTASPQGLSAMQRVETARSRAMDDAAAAGTDEYVNARLKLLDARQGARERLGTGELTNEIGLGEDQNKLTTGLSVQQGEGLRGENVRHAGQLTGLDQARSGAAINTQNTAMDRITANQGREMEINDQDARNAAMRKALATGDWDTMNQLQSRMSDAELEAIGLHRDEFNTGMGYRTADLGERNQGAAQVGNYGQQQLDYGLRASGAAQGWGNTAENAYQTAYGYEAPKAGYGAKMLAAAGGAALNMAVPGAGTALTGAVGGAYGYPQQGGYGGPQQGGYGGYNPQNPYGTGPYGTPPFIPNNPPGGGYPMNYGQQPSMMQGLTNLYGTIGGLFKPKLNNMRDGG